MRGARAGAEISATEELRLAAKMLRERADAATPGPWQHMCLGSEGCQVLRASGTVRERGRGRVARFGLKDWQADHADAEYVASMPPTVALAIADWLDECSRDVEGTTRRSQCCEPRSVVAALNVARACLGTSDSSEEN